MDNDHRIQYIPFVKYKLRSGRNSINTSLKLSCICMQQPPEFFRIPVRFIGLGEKMEDLQEFDLDKYLYGLLLGEREDE